MTLKKFVSLVLLLAAVVAVPAYVKSTSTHLRPVLTADGTSLPPHPIV